MVRWHHQLNGHEFGQTLEVADGQGSLVCCGSWGRKDSDTTERLNRLTFLIAQLVKNPLAMQEVPVQFLDWEDPLVKG